MWSKGGLILKINVLLLEVAIEKYHSIWVEADYIRLHYMLLWGRHGLCPDHWNWDGHARTEDWGKETRTLEKETATIVLRSLYFPPVLVFRFLLNFSFAAFAFVCVSWSCGFWKADRWKRLKCEKRRVKAERRIPFWPLAFWQNSTLSVLNPVTRGPAWSHNIGFQNILSF